MARRTIVFAWELGAGLGHAVPLAMVARRLAISGHRCVLAFRNPSALPACGIEVVQAPLAGASPERRAAPAASYADTLAMYGYDDAGTLGAMVRGWRALYDETGADLVVIDHGPAAALAARGFCPVIQIGNGYVLPPDDGETFPLLTDVVPLVPQAMLLDTANHVLRAHGAAPLDCLPALLSADARFLRTIALVDPYAEARREPYVGPLEPMPQPSDRPESRSLYAYVKAGMPRFRQAMAAFGAMNAERTAFVDSIDSEMLSRLARRGVRNLDRPLPLCEAVSQARAILSNGSTGVSVAAAAAGRPQVAIPMHLENRITARRLEERGVLLLPPAEGGGPAIRRALERALSDPDMAARAAALARTIDRNDSEQALARIVSTCEALLA